ncbi:MAG: branched-chain amino acid transport system ATP-binding protein [Frankiales bacterium]|jgi:branched-chain amino acid transport system ATP-binding protein|nr:branched-chain amino acid transport system ATP-binding protein [Frankiales bacterium]
MIELELRGARAGYGPVEALHGVDLVVAHGRLTALLGSNGAGKTTLLSVLAGLVPLRAGVLRWQGGDVTRCSAGERVRRGMLLVPEGHGIFPGLPVQENLRVFARGGDPAAALEAFPVLAERLGQRAGSLSGGEQQMLAMSRALLQRPQVLLLDELSSGLAPQVAAQLLALARRLADDGTTVLLVEQYAAEALAIADHVHVLGRGSVLFSGEPGELSHGVPGVTRPVRARS